MVNHKNEIFFILLLNITIIFSLLINIEYKPRSDCEVLQVCSDLSQIIVTSQITFIISVSRSSEEWGFVKNFYLRLNIEINAMDLIHEWWLLRKSKPYQKSAHLFQSLY